MYQYTEFDKQFVQARAAQYRDQLTRNLAGELGDDEFRPLRLQNGWYVQRYAPMLRVAVPYGELNSAQLQVLAKIARDYDTPSAELLQHAQCEQDKIGGISAPPLTTNYGHFTTRQNLQLNWIKLEDAPDILAELAPEGINPSIQSAPLGFKPRVTGPDVVAAYTENVLRVVAHLVAITARTGVAVALEASPVPASVCAGIFFRTRHEAHRKPS